MEETIGADKRQPNRNLAMSSAEPGEISEVIENIRKKNGGDDGARTRDLRRDRPAF